MKTLILYASKYGATGEIARRIAEKMPEATVCNIKTDKIPQLSKFDCIIIGSSLYAGMIRKEAKEYITQNTTELCKKKFGLFLSGFEPTNEKIYFTNKFSGELLEAATATAFLGGIFDPEKVGFPGRFIVKKIAKQSDYLNNISNDKISSFIGELNRKANI